MILHGRLLQGVVVLDAGCSLPDGTAVTVAPLEDRPTTAVGDALARLAGKAEDLPVNLAEDHDDYRRGQTK